jgi:hypothetical protein
MAVCVSHLQLARAARRRCGSRHKHKGRAALKDRKVHWIDGQLHLRLGLSRLPAIDHKPDVAAGEAEARRCGTMPPASDEEEFEAGSEEEEEYQDSEVRFRL